MSNARSPLLNQVRPRKGQPVTDEWVCLDQGGMSLACGHKSDGFVRGSANSPLYHCPTCGTAEESIFSLEARERYNEGGWGGVFKAIRARAKTSDDQPLAALVRLLLPFAESFEGAGWGHGYRDADGRCDQSGNDCWDCQQLERIRKWVDRNG